MTRAGSWLFALALGILSMGGARELLRPSGATVRALAALGASALVVGIGAPRWAAAVCLYGAGQAALLHAASAAQRRVGESPRVRVLVATLVLLGVLGLLLAIGLRLGTRVPAA